MAVRHATKTNTHIRSVLSDDKELNDESSNFFKSLEDRVYESDLNAITKDYDTFATYCDGQGWAMAG